MDIIITMPDIKKQGVEKLKEFYSKEEGYLYYRVPTLPKSLCLGDRCFIVSNGLLIGSHEVVAIRKVTQEEASKLSDGNWTEGFYIIRDAKSFKPFKTQIKMKGFQGYRYRR